MTRSKSPLLRTSIALNILLIGLLAVGIWYGLAVQERIKSNQENRHTRIIAERASAFAASQLERADVVFLGDSITQAGAWDEYFPGMTVANRGVSSDGTEHVLKRLDTVVRLEPGKIFLMIGVNDIASGRDMGAVEADYAAILDRFAADLPDAQVYVQSVLPVDAQFFIPGINESAATLNAWLEREAEERGYNYVDVRSLFEKDDGTLDRVYSRDGLHLAGEAYAKWRDLVTPLVMERASARGQPSPHSSR